jgi:putative membrane protein
MANDPDRSGPDDEAVEEFEPDYRFTLANERTFLAWQRTALGLLAAAVAIVQLVPELALPGARHVIGGLLAALAMLAAGAGLYRWNQVDHAMRRGMPLPKTRAPLWIGLGLAVVGVILISLVVANVVGA